MELKIGVQELSRALARSQGIVEKKSTMPILSLVLLEAAKGDVLHVSATDLDISVSSEHACEVLKEGRVAVPAKQLFEIVRSLPSSPERVIEVRSEPDRPQPRRDRDAGRGMTTVVGRVREDPLFHVKFVVLSHNTIRGAAGGSLLNAELLVAQGIVT